MRLARGIVIVAVAASLLAGCSSFKKLTGQRNDTILPGEREDILPADQQVNPKPGKADDLPSDLAPSASACDPAVDVNCTSPIDQDASGAGTE